MPVQVSCQSPLSVEGLIRMGPQGALSHQHSGASSHQHPTRGHHRTPTFTESPVRAILQPQAASPDQVLGKGGQGTATIGQSVRVANWRQGSCEQLQHAASHSSANTVSNLLPEEQSANTFAPVCSSNQKSEPFTDSACVKVEILCDKAQSLIYEMSSLYAPPTPTPQGPAEAKIGVGRPPKPPSPIPPLEDGRDVVEQSSVLSAASPQGSATAGTVAGMAALHEQEQELADLRCRMSRMELVMDSSQCKGENKENVGILREQVSHAQNQLKDALSEMADTKVQLGVLTKLINMLTVSGADASCPDATNAAKSQMVLPQKTASPRPGSLLMPPYNSMQLPTTARHTEVHSAHAHSTSARFSVTSTGSYVPVPYTPGAEPPAATKQHHQVQQSSPHVSTAPPLTVRLYSNSLQFDRSPEARQATECPPVWLGGLIAAAGTRRPALLQNLMATSALSPAVEFLQECARAGLSTESTARQQELWRQLGPEERRQLWQLGSLAEGQQDELFQSFLEEDRRRRQKLAGGPPCWQWNMESERQESMVKPGVPSTIVKAVAPPMQAPTPPVPAITPSVPAFTPPVPAPSHVLTARHTPTRTLVIAPQAPQPLTHRVAGGTPTRSIMPLPATVVTSRVIASR